MNKRERIARGCKRRSDLNQVCGDAPRVLDTLGFRGGAFHCETGTEAN